MLFKRKRLKQQRGKKYSAFLNFSQYGPNNDSGVIEATFKNLTASPQRVNMFQYFDTSNVQVTTTGSGGYDQLVRSVNTKPFVAKDFKVFTTTSPQLSQPFVFTYKNARGTTKQQVIVPSRMKSMYQNVPTEVDTLGASMIVDGDASIEFTLLPNEEVTIVITMGQQIDDAKKLSRGFKNTIDSQYVIDQLMSNQALNHPINTPGPGNTFYKGVEFVN